MKRYNILFLFTFLPLVGFTQITLCNNATPICGSSTFLNTTNTNGFGLISCLVSTPNPRWSIFKTNSSGNLVFNLKQGNNSPFFNNLDVDYICWGPFNEIPNCSTQLYGYPTGNTTISNNIISCSFSGSATETITVPNTVSGQFYVILSINFSNQAGTIVLTQTNSLVAGAGSTKCDYAVVNDAPDDVPFQTNANFNVSTLNVISYRWQMSTNGTDWVNLFDGGTNPTISGSGTNALNLTTIPISYIGNYFRVNLTTNTENINSNYARITGALNSNNFNVIINEIVVTAETISFGRLNGKIKIFDINGRLLVSKEISPNSDFRISDFKKGIYFVNIDNYATNSNYNQKFLKN